MSDVGNPWADATMVKTCAWCRASAEHPAPVKHTSTCVQWQKVVIEERLFAEESGGWHAVVAP